VLLRSSVQRLICRRLLESEGTIKLSSLKEEASKLVGYRAEAALSQNSIILEERGIIIREKRNRRVHLKLNPLYAERLRAELGVKAEYALISGFTYNPKHPRNIKPLFTAIDAVKLLSKKGYKIQTVYCFTTPEAASKLKLIGTPPWFKPTVKAEPWEYYITDYKKILTNMENTIKKLVTKYTVIVDLTPLSKLYTLAAYKAAEKYYLPAIYHPEEDGKIIWVSRKPGDKQAPR